jgi:hypothetical protein
MVTCTQSIGEDKVVGFTETTSIGDQNAFAVVAICCSQFAVISAEREDTGKS